MTNLSSIDLVATIQHSPIGMAILSPTGAWLEANPALTKLVGYSRDELLDNDSRSITHPDDLELDLAYVTRLLAGELPRYAMEKRYIRKDGRIVWVEHHATLVWNNDGTAKHFIAQIVDITERRESAESLRASRAKLLFGMQFAMLGYWEYDVALDRFSFDEDVLRLYRTTKEAERSEWSIADYIREFVVAEDAPVVANALLAAMASSDETYASSYEHRVVCRDGTPAFIRVRFSVVREEGRTVRLFGALQDVTDCRQAEQGVRDSEERLRQLTEHLSEVVWMSTVEKDQMLYISPTYAKVWGRSCESLYATPWSWIESIHPDDRELVSSAAVTQRVPGKFDLEYRIVRPDGEIRWIHDRAFPICDSAGRVYRIGGIAEDITDRRRIEEQYRQAQKMDAIGQLAGGVAHDFNNILSAIMMEVDDAASQPGLTEEALEPIRGISAAAERAANLTRQLLLFCRKQMMQPRQIDLNETVASVAKLFRRVLPETVTTELRLNHSPTLTFADSGMLDQVMMNLAVNARDAMPSGGTLTIETKHRAITEEDARSILDASPGLYVVLRVTDTGCGIAADQMSHIFEPFFTTKVPGRGTGLGLATVFGIVKQHRGWITASSTVGHGTTFEVLLPATRDPVTAPHDFGARPFALGGNETILLVEDEPILRRVIRMLLVRKGYRVLEAASGLDALAIWETSADVIDLLFTDLVMPDGLDGHGLANQLQACKPSLKVILTSGYSTDVELRLGQHYLAKPCQPRQLLETVRACLEAPAGR